MRLIYLGVNHRACHRETGKRWFYIYRIFCPQAPLVELCWTLHGVPLAPAGDKSTCLHDADRYRSRHGPVEGCYRILLVMKSFFNLYKSSCSFNIVITELRASIWNQVDFLEGARPLVPLLYIYLWYIYHWSLFSVPWSVCLEAVLILGVPGGCRPQFRHFPFPRHTFELLLWRNFLLSWSQLPATSAQCTSGPLTDPHCGGWGGVCYCSCLRFLISHITKRPERLWGSQDAREASLCS